MNQHHRPVPAAIAIVSLLTLLSAGGAAAQAPPSTDVYLASMDLSTQPPAIGAPRNVTDRDGYDNQPSFTPDGAALLYTSQRDGQTDIWRLDLATGTASPATTTPESEYSALPLPSGGFGVIRVEADGTQRLWAFPDTDAAPYPVFPDLAPVGYHAWNASGQVAMFVLGEPATLWMGEGDAPASPRQVAADIGRSLQPIPGSDDFSFLQRVDGVWQLRRLRPDGTVEPFGAPLEGSQDLVWCPDGRALMARGSEIWVRDAEGAWQLAADLSAHAVADVTRLAISPDGRWLALVAAH